MKTIDYSYKCSHTGLEYKCRALNVDHWNDEPYPPGGELRVMRDSDNRIIAGPMVSELTSWKETDHA